jgi:hypothetical protein
MGDWLPLVIIIVIVMFMIGNFSTVQKSAKRPLRKKSLNDLEETLPRTHKTEYKLPTVKK